MNIKTEKLNLIEWLLGLKDTSIIETIQLLKQNSIQKKTDWWDEISEAEKTSINKGLNDLKEGKKIPYREIRKDYAKWLTK